MARGSKKWFGGLSSGTPGLPLPDGAFGRVRCPVSESCVAAAETGGREDASVRPERVDGPDGWERRAPAKCFEDGPERARPVTVVNRWLWELRGQWDACAAFVGKLRAGGEALGGVPGRARGQVARYAAAAEGRVGPVCRASGRRAAGLPVRGDDLAPADEHPVAVLPVSDGRGVCGRGAVHLPRGAGPVRVRRT